MKYSKEFYEATDVRRSCFVFASAGSGKTKILVDRYIKSLFLGINPKDILCITYTNAAVFEMESRISDILEKLYLNENGFTERYLKETLNLSKISRADIEKAESLFFDFQNSLSQLKIMTTHSFCQMLLQQFPLESEIFPNFRIINDIEALSLLKEAKDTVLAKLPEEIIKKLAGTISIKTLEDFIDQIYQFLPKFVDFFNVHNSMDEYELEISKLFNLDSFQEFSKEQENFINEFFKNDDLEEIYLTTTGSLRKKIPYSDNPISLQIAKIVSENVIRRNKLKTIDKTCSFLRLVKEIVEEYQNLKKFNNELDFSDVLYQTKFLLTKSYAKDFVISTICSQIKAIMIDEAQDLSLIQWDLIYLFAEDIFSDPSSQKTIFVVGDIKQSIYRFQGADCKLFAECYQKTSEIFKASGRELKTVFLSVNYRSLPEILKNVDRIFEGEIAKFAFESDIIQYQKHLPFRSSDIGKVEIIKCEDAENIALEIAKLISAKTTENSIILARERTDLSRNIMKEISNLGLKIAPPDRISLNESVLVMDLLAVADFCVDHNNDYAFCCVMKSPYIFENPLTNDEFFDLLYNKTSSTYENLKLKFPLQYSNLQELISDFDENNLLKFFYYLANRLINLTQNESHILSAFLDEVKNFAKNNSESIPEFLDYIKSREIKIANQGITKSGLRLSTIHGAKGLEAQTIFLLDFDIKVAKSKVRFLFSDGLFFIKPSQKESFFEINQISNDEYNHEERELFRLLYVAMTRAKDNLYVLSYSQNCNNMVSNLIGANNSSLNLKIKFTSLEDIMVQ